MTAIRYEEIGRLGVSSALIQEAGERGLLLRHRQDVTPILESNRQEQSNYNPRWQHANRAGIRKVASIPFVVWQKFAEWGIVSLHPFKVLDERRLLRILSDPEMRWLRTDNAARLA